MANKINPSMDEIKKQLSKSRCSVNSIKNDMRQQFRDRLKEMRRNNLYTVRNISEHVDKLKNLRKALSIDGSVLTPTEIIELLEEVENEIHFENNHTQCDQYINDTNVILEELMTGVTFCPICDKVLEHTDIINNICKQCSDSFNVK